MILCGFVGISGLPTAILKPKRVWFHYGSLPTLEKSIQSKYSNKTKKYHKLTNIIENPEYLKNCYGVIFNSLRRTKKIYLLSSK